MTTGMTYARQRIVFCTDNDQATTGTVLSFEAGIEAIGMLLDFKPKRGQIRSNCLVRKVLFVPDFWVVVQGFINLMKAGICILDCRNYCRARIIQHPFVLIDCSHSYRNYTLVAGISRNSSVVSVGSARYLKV